MKGEQKSTQSHGALQLTHHITHYEELKNFTVLVIYITTSGKKKEAKKINEKKGERETVSNGLLMKTEVVFVLFQLQQPFAHANHTLAS